MVSGFTFQPLIHFKLIFVSGLRKGSSVIILHVNIRFFKYYALKELSFPHCILIVPLSDVSWPYIHEFFPRLSSLFHYLPVCFYASTFLFWLV